MRDTFLFKTLAALLLFSLPACGRSEEANRMDLSGGWKFSQGDDKAWSQAAFDDKGWKSIQVGKSWSTQGYKDYKGFGWYRRKVTVPAAWLKDPYFVKEGKLKLSLGHVMDADETFFNGQKIGGVGSVAPKFRSDGGLRDYLVPAELVKKENVIAVRVNGSFLGGGMFAGPYVLRTYDWTDYVEVKFGLGRGDGSFPAGVPMDLAAMIENKGITALAGSLTCTVSTDDGKPVACISKPLDLVAGKKTRKTFNLKSPQPGVYRVTFGISPVEGTAVLTRSMNLAYAPEKMKRPLTRQPDFEEFWKKTKAELAAVEPQYKVTLKKEYALKTQDIYEVEMRSLGNVRVRGWYSVPKKPGRYPVILEQPGAGGEMGPQLWDGLDDFIFFSLNPRGHGNSQDDFKPSKMGFWYTGLESKETFAFRGAYMDAVRAVDFLMTRPEVDKRRVVAEGISQGGGLSLALAALDPRVKYCVADVPGMADWESYETVRLDLNNGGWARWTDAHPGSTKEELMAIMSYCDNMNLAPWIKADTWVVSGLQDPRVPPRGVYEAYSHIKSRKKITIFPYGDHNAGGGAQWFDKYRVLRKKFHMPINPAFESVAQAKGK